ncbi:hypothetical protein N5P37_008792 [Trichoderma harzianum]|uniref:Uncharacterized protein n=1 Tax=Trichoderma harzianum CBS 226.95 TaxID=983964 RepID=A0A2T4A761_TRIHA|nr:hypothetical protein M431DRAFT_497180 [Trichoderma harzianum CBS 226.95]KAK0758394.1 hypothetical protein N5P37_008792 [Trichoderma harzianum]PTB52858.1 hypothetical protein M431DRAFT_497180 [Trichoderma harzianum CBS 226.95]
MKVSTTTAPFSLGYLQYANAICNSGEVGIGRKQEYEWQGQNNVLVNDQWATLAALGPSYGSRNGINSCDSSGMPGFVWTNGANFHNCYGVSESCATGPFLYEPIYWCCQSW